MRYRSALVVPLLLFAPIVDARQVQAVQPLTLAKGQPVKIIGMDLEFAPEMLAELSESDAKAAGKRASAGLAPLDPNSYPVGPQDGAAYATMPFKQMFPLVMRDVSREWGLDRGVPIRLHIRLDKLQTANAALAVMVGSSDILQGGVNVMDATSGASIGFFRVEVRNSHGGWGGLLIRGGGIREKLAEEFGLELARYIAGGKKLAKN